MISQTYDSKRVIDKIRSLIEKHNAAYWTNLFEGKDCCCTIVKSVDEAVNDIHFKSRGLFNEKLANDEGEKISALPTCLAPIFRPQNSFAIKSPALNDN